MKKLSLVAFLMMLALAMQASTGLVAGARAQVSQRRSSPSAQTASTTGSVAAIIELQSEPVAVHQQLAARLPRKEVDFDSSEARTYEAQLDVEHESFKSRAALLSPRLRIRTELRRLANIVSIEATPFELTAIAAMPGVKRVELVKQCFPTLDTSVPLINAPAIWDRLGGPSSAGEGMRIAIIDTGIDITNPLFSDLGFTAPAGFPRTNGNGSNAALTNNKVIVAKGFLVGSNSALDQNGHGTNVAGIAAGDSGTISPLGTLSGVAPRAYLGNYRVIDQNGNGGGSDLIGRAIDEAVADHFDVINMSLGTLDPATASGFLEDVVQGAVTQGVVVVIAAGNTNDTDAGQPMTISSPGISPAAITVGATSNSHLAGPRATAILTVPGSDDPTLASVAAPRGIGALNPPALDGAIGPLLCVDVSTLDGGNRGCSALPSGSLKSKIALIERGNSCSFAQKVNDADQAGAAAVIIYNKDASEGTDGGENLFPFQAADTRILSVLVKRSTGLALKSWLLSHAGAQVTITPQAVGEVSVPSDLLATFSALGPSVIEGLKPDVSAPGISIYSGAIKAGDVNKGVVDPSGFVSEQGTSQATPHVAGAAALIRQLNPTFTPEQVKSVLISSAITDVFIDIAKTNRAGVLDTGGGRIDLARASSVTATLSPASLSFGIRKLKGKDVSVSIDLKITSVIDGQNTFTVGVQQLDPGTGITVTSSTGSLSLTRGQTDTATITIAAVAGSQRRDYTGYVLIAGGGQTLHVPYWVRFVKKKN
jgi:minor extracellular serine protease Vpr